MVWMVSTMVRIASRAISWPLRTVARNWSCSSCWVLVVLAIVCASMFGLLLTISSIAWHVKQLCLVYFATVTAVAGASAGAGALGRAAGGGRLGVALGRRGLRGRRLRLRGSGLGRRGLGRGLLGGGGLGGGLARGRRGRLRG